MRAGQGKRGKSGGGCSQVDFEQESTVEALPFIIDGLRQRGFTLLGLESLPPDR